MARQIYVLVRTPAGKAVHYGLTDYPNAWKAACGPVGMYEQAPRGSALTCRTCERIDIDKLLAQRVTAVVEELLAEPAEEFVEPEGAIIGAGTPAEPEPEVQAPIKGARKAMAARLRGKAAPDVVDELRTATDALLAPTGVKSVTFVDDEPEAEAPPVKPVRVRKAAPVQVPVQVEVPVPAPVEEAPEVPAEPKPAGVPLRADYTYTAWVFYSRARARVLGVGMNAEDVTAHAALGDRTVFTVDDVECTSCGQVATDLGPWGCPKTMDHEHTYTAAAA